MLIPWLQLLSNRFRISIVFWGPFWTSEGVEFGRLQKPGLCVEEGYRWLPKRRGCPGQRYTRVWRSLESAVWQKPRRVGFERSEEGESR